MSASLPTEIEKKALRKQAPMKSAIAFAVGVIILVLGSAWAMWEYLEWYKPEDQPRTAGQIVGLDDPREIASGAQTFAGPRLQTDEAADMRALRAEHLYLLDTGAPGMPIEEAMKRVLAEEAAR